LNDGDATKIELVEGAADDVVPPMQEKLFSDDDVPSADDKNDDVSTN
jgi:hypothetical protein